MLIVINIAPLTELFPNCLLFCDYPLADFQLPAMFVGLLWLTSNHMYGSGYFEYKSPSWFSKILKLPSFY